MHTLLAILILWLLAAFPSHCCIECTHREANFDVMFSKNHLLGVTWDQNEKYEKLL